MQTEFLIYFMNNQKATEHVLIYQYFVQKDALKQVYPAGAVLTNKGQYTICLKNCTDICSFSHLQGLTPKWNDSTCETA